MDKPQTPEPADEPLLNLDTLIRRPKVAIDGITYEIMTPDELSIIDSHRFGMWGRRIKELASAESEAEEAELIDLVDRVARKVAVGVPAEIYAGLSGKHKLAISDVFTGLLLRNSLGVAGAIAKAAGIPIGILPTGAMPFPDFNGSTAAVQAGGWRKRLSRWFGRS